MDSTVIEEIAKQLGMAVDQAGQFISEHLPDYAALKCMQATVSIWQCWVVCLLFLIPFVISAIVLRKAYKKHTRCHLDDFISFWVSMFSGVLLVIAVIFSVVITGFNLTDAIGWANYPEAMLIDKAIEAIR